MKSYVINLDRRVERWQYVREHLASLGIRVIRFSAIDTKPGWAGCRESHLRIMELCKDEEVFTIYEDDVKFVGSPDSIEPIMSQLPPDWDCLYLGASPKEPQERYSDSLFRLKNAHVTHAIIWHNRKDGAIEYILSHKHHIRKWDDYLATVIQPMFNCFVVYPLVATQETIGNSDTCTRSDLTTIIKNYNEFCI